MLRCLLMAFILLLPKATLADEGGHWPLVLAEAQIWPRQFIPDSAIYSGIAPAGGYRASTTTWRTDNVPELSKGLGYAGYWIELPKLEPGQYELALDFATSAYEAVLFPKGFPERSLHIVMGRPGVDAASEIAFLKRQIISFQALEGDEWALAFNISNFHRTYGGFWRAPRLAPASFLQTHVNIKAGMNFAIAGAMLITALYTFMLFYRRRADLPALFLSITCVAILLRLIGIENLASFFVESVDSNRFFDVVVRLEFGSMALVTLAFLAFLRRTFMAVRLPKALLIVCHGSSLLLIMTSIVADPAFLTQWVGLFQINVLLHVIVMIVVTGKAFQLKEDGAGYMLASALIPLIAGVIDVVHSRYGGTSYISHFAGAAFIFLQSQILAKRFAGAYTRAEHLSAHLGQEVAKQTQQIRNIMNNVPEGLFTLGKDLCIQGQCSQYVNVSFADAMLHNLPDLLTYNTAIDRSSLDMAVSVLLSIIGEDVVSWEINHEHLFTELETLDQRKLAFQWHPIIHEDVVDSMLVIVRDTTEIRDLRERALHQEQEMVLISALAKAKSYRFQSFLAQSKESVKTIRSIWTFNRGSSDQSYIRLILALLHTFKGNSRQIGFTELARDIHGFEQNIVDLRETHGEENADFSVALDSGLLSIATSLDLIESLHNRYWGEQDHLKDRLLLGPDDMRQLQAWIDGRLVDEAGVKRLLRSRLQSSFTERWDELQSDLARVAAHLGKAPTRLSFELPENLWLSPDFQTCLLNALGHLLRNAIDHGIESPRDRADRGKELRGSISIKGRWSDKALAITIEDDGRGVDREGLLARSFQKQDLGLGHTLDLMLTSGLTTASRVSEISGRGIGMDAVRLEVERLGGSLRIEARDLYPDGNYPRFIPFRIHLIFPETLFQ